MGHSRDRPACPADGYGGTGERWEPQASRGKNRWTRVDMYYVQLIAGKITKTYSTNFIINEVLTNKRCVHFTMWLAITFPPFPTNLLKTQRSYLSAIHRSINPKLLNSLAPPHRRDRGALDRPYFSHSETSLSAWPFAIYNGGRCRGEVYYILPSVYFGLGLGTLWALWAESQR